MYYQASFQDILFVLAGIAWIAYSAYRSNAKKQQNDKAVQGKNKSGFESLLDEVMAQFDVEDKPETEINIENIAAAATPVEEETSLRKSGSLFSDEERPVEQVGAELKIDERSSAEEEVAKKARTAYNIAEQKVRKNKFDLKKAFIYSEILNRKYI
jgi:hypothetical protein